MTLPTSRNTSYAALSQIKSADLNALQDNVIALYAALHGDRTLHIGAAKFVGDGNSGRLSQFGFVTPASAMIAYAPIELPAGKRIKTVTVYYNPNGGGSMLPKLQRMDPSTGTITAVWTGSSDSTGTAIESQTNSPNHTILASDVYWIECALVGAANRLYGAVITYDEP